MISVLIPSYNYNVYPLVKELHKQLSIENILFEIICFDDASSELIKENDNLNSLVNVYYRTLDTNIGRSAIRNKLAEEAKYNWLLFLDADVYPNDKYFIKNYLNAINKNSGINIFCGGLLYEEKQPDLNNFLRWNVGKNGEECSMKVRLAYPYRKFFSANFLIRRELFFDVKFNEYIKTYGYEDVLFASDLKSKNYKVVHIQNAVFHLGIEKNKDFIDKTKIALQSLLMYKEMGVLTSDNVKLLNYFKRIKRMRLVLFFSTFYILFGKNVEKYLINEKSLLAVFNFYKIIYFSYIFKKSN